MAAAGIGFTSFGQADSEYSSLIKANIEALAEGEDGEMFDHCEEGTTNTCRVVVVTPSGNYIETKEGYQPKPGYLR